MTVGAMFARMMLVAMVMNMVIRVNLGELNGFIKNLEGQLSYRHGDLLKGLNRRYDDLLRGLKGYHDHLLKGLNDLLNDLDSRGGHDAHPCPGRQDAVRLCEHVNISWANIEPYLSKWQQCLDPRDGQACLDGFSVQYRDPSHDRRWRVEDEDVPTWPRASLENKTHTLDSWIVILNFEREPHIGIDVFSLTPDGRAPASKMRALFQSYRQSAAAILFPSFPQLPFPEMACFKDDANCQCLRYEAVSDPSKPTQGTMFSSPPP
ncbi:hypothetical protein B0H67DRAFT_680894 [Lasiosphaeris hirsuta]|uniref:Uncharacterized protein n=1 Tax=Lasiosphaeris hirsuta TaxID=260670 RepID=A0AA40B114_9PEZI|nr:hypothetical protein B0H67DRAFT_680894 [Lasiosphaeris hirsuta]